MTTPENWQKVKEIVGEALEREADERGAYLDVACAQDSELRAEVESLLAAHADADALSQDPWATAVKEDEPEATTIGPYRLLRVLGVGGMGKVWLAEQTEPVRRRVALKLIRAGMIDSSAAKRFHSERQSLAIMDHPAIAKVFDAGATPAGQPYLVMEYVDGLPITEYCDKKKLGIRERLKLFIQVCEGVQHAHQKAIIHRDLKPSNVLVVEVDGKPQPRIIDFGLAKTTVPRALGETLFTHVGGFLGTPGYMSPEQADPNVHDVDTRTDVYSLGVVLYELLTGSLPFDTAKWKQQGLEEVLRELRTSDPPRPSTKVSSNRDTSSAQAEARSTEPRQLVGVLRGDLDWITLMALEKERERRYGTPSALANDVENYLANRPVEARPASTAYRVRKYLRRHALGASVAAGAAALLIAFAVMQTVELRRITRERDRADRITEFMSNMFKVSDPSEARGNTITAREILDKASKDINTGLSRDPELQASMLALMGKVYNRLGLYARAEDLLSPALQTRRRVLGSEHPDTLATMVDLANALSDQAKFTQGDKLYEEVIETSRHVGNPARRRMIAAMNNLALNLRGEGRIADAEKVQRDTIDVLRKERGPEHPDTLTAISNLALMLHAEGHLVDAEEMDRQILELRTRTLGPDHPDTLRSAANLALDLQEQQGRDPEAEQLLRSTLEAQRRVVGPEHPDTLVSMDALGKVLAQEKRLAESESITRQEVEILRRTRGAEHPRTLDAISNLASLLDQEGNHTEAVRQFRQLWEIHRRTDGPEHPDTLLAQTSLSAALQSKKQLSEAEKLARGALAVERRTLGDENIITLEQMYILANILYQQGHTQEAEALLRETQMHQAHVFGADSPKTARSTYLLGTWAALRGDREGALVILRQAIFHGLDAATVQGMEKDLDLKSLRGDSRFQALLREASARTVGAQNHK